MIPPQFILDKKGINVDNPNKRGVGESDDCKSLPYSLRVLLFNLHLPVEERRMFGPLYNAFKTKSFSLSATQLQSALFSPMAVKSKIGEECMTLY